MIKPPPRHAPEWVKAAIKELARRIRLHGWPVVFYKGVPMPRSNLGPVRIHVEAPMGGTFETADLFLSVSETTEEKWHGHPVTWTAVVDIYRHVMAGRPSRRRADMSAIAGGRKPKKSPRRG